MASTPSWSAGHKVTAAELNFLLGGASGRKPSMRAITSAVLSIGNATEVTPTGLTAVEDTDNGLNTSTGVYQVQTAGMWVVMIAPTWATNTTGYRGIHLGPAWNWFPAAAPNQVGTLAVVQRYSAGNNIAPTVYQNSGAALNLNSYEIDAVWIGA